MSTVVNEPLGPLDLIWCDLATNYKLLHPLIVPRGPNCVCPSHCYQKRWEGGTAGQVGQRRAQWDNGMWDTRSGTHCIVPQIREGFTNRLTIKNIRNSAGNSHYMYIWLSMQILPKQISALLCPKCWFYQRWFLWTGKLLWLETDEGSDPSVTLVLATRFFRFP